MFRKLAAGHFLLLLLALTALASDDKHSIKELTAQPPADVDPAIAKLLSDRFPILPIDKKCYPFSAFFKYSRQRSASPRVANIFAITYE